MIRFLILFIFLSLSFSQITIIANKSVDESSVDNNMLRDIYTLSKNRWADGTKIKCFDYSDKTDTQAEFYMILNKQPVQLKKEWLRKKLTGKGNPPKLLSSEEEMINMVAKTEGAIGYIISSNVNSSVKVLAKF
jgi:ABC-type phosphate transport system substrate-binding protein